MAKYTSPVTKDSFPEFWTHVWHKYGQAKRSYAIGKLIGIFGQLVFLLSLLLVTAGGIYSLNVPVVNSFFESVPYLIPAWNLFQETFFTPEMQTPAKVGICALAVYGISIAACVVMTAVVWVLYHPIAKKPSGDFRQDVDTAAKKAHKARVYTVRAKHNISTTCTILYLVSVTLVFTVVILVNIDTEGAVDQISMIIPIRNMLALVEAAFIMFFGYALLDSTFVQITKWLFYCKVSYRLLTDADRLKLLAMEEPGELDEAALAEKRLAEAAEKRDKALDLERCREYARAKTLFYEAALGGDPAAMDHYARHCIIIRSNEEAIFWLQCCVDTGSADDVTVKRLKDMKRGRHLRLQYHA